MSRSVDLFISSAAPLDELAATIAARTGLAPDGDPPDGDGDQGVALRSGDLSAILHEHRFVDDGDLDLTRYRWALSTRTTATGHLGLSPQAALLRQVAAALADHRVLLVLDLQYRVASREATR